MARREDKEAAKKGKFFTTNNDNSNTSINQKNKYRANDSGVNRIDQIGGNPT